MPLTPAPYTPPDPTERRVPDFMGYIALWEKLHPQRSERWNDNPPVYALEFEVVG